MEVLVSHWAVFDARHLMVMSRRMLELLRFPALRAKARVLPYEVETAWLRPGARNTARASWGSSQSAWSCSGLTAHLPSSAETLRKRRSGARRR